MEIATCLEEVASPFPAILLDAYGVFWSGGIGPFPGARETMERLVLSGKKVGILSNSTQLAEKEIAKLQSHGLFLGKHFHFYLTSGQIAKEIFSQEKLPFPTLRKKFWLLGNVHPRFASHKALFEHSAYEETPHLEEADFIYLSIPHVHGEDQETVDHFQEEVLRAKKRGIPLICTNPDKYAHEGNPPKAVVRQGSLAALFEQAGGEVFYTGKPEPMAYLAAMEHFACLGLKNPKDVLMVGDTPETDIRGAKRARMASCLVLYTGIMADRIEKMGLVPAISSCEDRDMADFFIERFAK
jgi:HAD superfamily hydrolase (TIGR01459 family)